MISYQKASKLGIASEDPDLLENSNKQKRFLIRTDCSKETIEDIRRLYGNVVFSDPLNAEEFDRSIQKIYKNQSIIDDEEMISLGKTISIEEATHSLLSKTSIENNSDDAPVIQMLNSIIAQSLAKGASDIHFEPNDESFDIKMRLDGNIINILSLRSEIASRIISRIKILGQINISERRLPQDGRVTFKLGQQIIDVRISTLPTGSGERVVMRILGKQNQLIKLDKLQMPENIYQNFKSQVRKPHGLILVTGPTGSGKTTTLYSAIDSIANLGLNIMTIEDPIEISFPGISQTQVNTKLGLNFADGLKAILRQDPDVIMVGEIRDPETASVALRASITGHLVLSTLHTNTAYGAISRLRDLGVDPYMISSSLNCVIAQRLLRKYCLNCRNESIQLGGNSSDQLFKLKGCDKCDYSGLQGRIAIFDYLNINAKLKNKISDGELLLNEENINEKSNLSSEAHKLVNLDIIPKFEAVRMTLNDNE